MYQEELKKAVSSLKPLTVKFKKDLKEALAILYPDYDTKEAACLFYLDLIEPPRCRVCGDRTPFYPLARAVIKANIGGWNDVCSHACSGIKNKETSMEKYGVAHHLKKESTSNSMQKKANTNLERYGKPHVLQVKSINDKMQENIRKKNGGYHFMQKESGSGAQEKIRTAVKIEFGDTYDHYFQTDDCKEKIKHTYNERFGTDHHTRVPEIRQKIEETWIRKYGVNNPWKNPEIIDQMQKDRYQKLSEIHPNEIARRFYTNLIEIDDATALQFELQEIEQKAVENSLIGVSRHTGIPLSHINSILANNPFLKSYINYDTRMSSFPERDLTSIFEQEGILVIRNDRKIIFPKELDCVFPEQKVAIEINGIYYHSEIRGGKNSSYHLDKTKGCNNQGYKLFHFTDIQLDTKKDIILSMMRNSLGKTRTKIYARRTEIRMVSRDDYMNFFNSNHIDGNARSKFAIGLFHENELVMCISFDKPRNGHDKGYEYEIIRMATKLDMNVVGGFQKIWSYFIKTYNPISVMSYQDRRYGGFPSNAYRSVMTLERITEPSWEVVNIKTGEVFHRLWFSSNRMKNLFAENYDDTKTTKENLVKNGFDYIWNCGNYVWSYKKENI